MVRKINAVSLGIDKQANDYLRVHGEHTRRERIRMTGEDEAPMCRPGRGVLQSGGSPGLRGQMFVAVVNTADGRVLALTLALALPLPLPSHQSR
jgi:hypothetical protein